MKDIIMTVIICAAISLAFVVGYDYLVTTPKIESLKLSVVDIDYILSVNEKLVRKGELSMDDYRMKVKVLEQFLSNSPDTIVSRYIRLNDERYPLIFGGKDITGYVMEHMEAAE